MPPPGPPGPAPKKKGNKAPVLIVLVLLVIAGVVAALLLLSDDDDGINTAFCDGLVTLSDQIADGDDVDDQAETVEELADAAESDAENDAVAEVADAYGDDDNNQADLADAVQDELGGFAEDCDLDPDEFAIAPSTTTTTEGQDTTTTEGQDTTTTTEGPTTTVVLGTGDVQVTLEWNSDADLDLAVTDPTGERIAFGNTGPTATGGELDVDSNIGCTDDGSIENIFWPPSGAPAGDYLVEVTGFTTDDCSQGAQSGDFVLTIRVAGQSDQVIPGTVGQDETLDFPFSV